jgi:hypothetical protein
LPKVPRLAAIENLAHARRGFQALKAWLKLEESRQLPLHLDDLAEVEAGGDRDQDTMP